MRKSLRNQLKQTALLTVAVFGLVVGLVPAPTASATTNSPYRGSCKPQYPKPDVHPANSLSPSGLATTASTAIGQLGKLAPAAGRPSWDGADRVNTLAQVDNTVYLGGIFNSYIWKGKTYSGFHNVMAINATTGAPVTSFKPNVNGEVLTIAPSCTGTLLFIGGNFSSVNGTTRHYAAKVAVSNGTLDVWNPNPNGIVETIRLIRGHVVVGGRFTQIGGAARSYIASVSQTAAAGTAESWLNISVSGSQASHPLVYLVEPNHTMTYMVMTGDFNVVGGVAHRRIAIVNLTDTKAAVTSWNTAWTADHGNANSGTDCSIDKTYPERGATFSPDDAYFYLVDTGGPHSSSLCDTISQWSASDAAMASTVAAPRAIMYTGGDTLTGVACTTVSCIATGHERWGDNPPIYPQKPIGITLNPMPAPPYNVPCSPKPISPYTENGHVGYDCQNPGVSKNRPGILEVSTQPVSSSLQSTPRLPLTAWNPGRSKQTAMHNFEMLTPQGLWLGTDGDAFGCPNAATGSTSGCTPHNDIVLVPFTN